MPGGRSGVGQQTTRWTWPIRLSNLSSAIAQMILMAQNDDAKSPLPNKGVVESLDDHALPVLAHLEEGSKPGTPSTAAIH